MKNESLARKIESVKKGNTIKFCKVKEVISSFEKLDFPNSQ